jgi:hypothetical protein
VLRRAGVRHQRHEHQPTVDLLWHERHRWRGHDVRDRRQLIGRRFRLGEERCDHVRARPHEHHTPEDLRELVQPIVEVRHDAEVPTAPPERPEEVRVRRMTGADELAVGGDDVGAQEVVDREAVLTHEEPHATRERDAAYPDGPGIPEASCSSYSGSPGGHHPAGDRAFQITDQPRPRSR